MQYTLVFKSLGLVRFFNLLGYIYLIEKTVICIILIFQHIYFKSIYECIFFIYSCDIKVELAAFTIWSLRNHSNILICCLRNFYYYPQFWKQLCCFIFICGKCTLNILYIYITVQKSLVIYPVISMCLCLFLRHLKKRSCKAAWKNMCKSFKCKGCMVTQNINLI